jgi:hypothetical protein
LRQQVGWLRRSGKDAYSLVGRPAVARRGNTVDARWAGGAGA